MKKTILISCFGVFVGIFNLHAQYLSTMNLFKHDINGTPTRDTLKLDITGAGVTNLSSINAATAAFGASFFDVKEHIVVNASYNMTGTNIFNNNQSTLKYLFFPDLSNSSGSLNVHYYPKGNDNPNDVWGLNFLAAYNGQRLSNTDSTTLSVSTYNIALGLEYTHTEIGRTNQYKITLGGNLNIIGINGDSTTNQNLEIIGLKKNNIIKEGNILGSNWYGMLTINQQATIFVRMYNSWGSPGFNKEFGAILFSFGVSVNANVLHVL